MTPVGQVGKELQAAGVKVHTLAITRGRISPAGLFRLLKLLRGLKPDLLQCWMYHANLLGLLAAKLAGVPHVIWGIRCSEIDFACYPRLTRWVVSLGARLSSLPDVTVVNSEAGAKVHTRWGYDSSKMVVIYNGFDLEQFKEDRLARLAVRRELGLMDDSPLIGLIARYDPMKDHENFFRAAGFLGQRRSDVNFLLCGMDITSENTDLARMVRTYGLEGNVHLLGLRDDIPRLTAALDIATSSAHGEGFCNAVGEAMSCGVPCVATDVGDAVRIVGEAGRVIPPRDPQALAAAWAELIDMGHHRRKALGSMARERIREKFSLASFQQAHESLYERIQNGASR